MTASWRKLQSVSLKRDRPVENDFCPAGPKALGHLINIAGESLAFLREA